MKARLSAYIGILLGLAAFPAILAALALLNGLNISYVIVSHEHEFLSKTTQKIHHMTAGRIQTERKDPFS